MSCFAATHRQRSRLLPAAPRTDPGVRCYAPGSSLGSNVGRRARFEAACDPARHAREEGGWQDMARAVLDHARHIRNPRMKSRPIKKRPPRGGEVRDGSVAILSCRSIARLVGRRARINAARLDTYRPSPCHVIGPGIGDQDRPVMALPARHVERPHTVGAHVAEGHWVAGRGSWSGAHTMAASGESCRRCGHVLTARFDPLRKPRPKQ
jgi:hypothetical protein